MNEQGVSDPMWRKSSYSGGSGACIEVTDNLTGVIAVRDSKNPYGPELIFAPVEWIRFMSQVKIFL